MRKASSRSRRCVLRSVWGLVSVCMLCSCATPHDYREFLEHIPSSILVLPPLNESPEVQAPYAYLATVSRPLAEQGYYVFPVAVIDNLLRDNGLPTPGEMHQVPLQKFREIIGADAVLYVTIKQWGTKYMVVDSVTMVSLEARLVDVKSGVTLWSGSVEQQQSASSGAGDPVTMLISALLNQVLTSVTDPSREVSARANTALIGNPKNGLLLGDYHAGAEEDREARRLAWEEHQASTAP